jgi:hypothetical protein
VDSGLRNTGIKVARERMQARFGVMDVDSREVAGFSTHQFLSKMHTIKGRNSSRFGGEACVV